MAPLLLLSFKIRRTHLCPPRPPELDRTQPLDFMLATLVGNGGAWSVATLPAIKVNSHPSRRLVKVRCDCGHLGYDLGYLRHGSFGRATRDGPADRARGPACAFGAASGLLRATRLP